MTIPPTWSAPGQGDSYEVPPVGSGSTMRQPYSGYGPPYPAVPPYGTPPARSGVGPGVWIGAGLALALSLVLCLCLGTVGGIAALFYSGYQLDKSVAVATLREYLEDVNAENYPAAYDRLCDKAKAGVSREGYVQRFGPPRLVGFEMGEASIASRDDEDGYDVKVELRFEDGRTRTETYFVFSTVSDMDTYYVCP